MEFIDYKELIERRISRDYVLDETSSYEAKSYDLVATRTKEEVLSFGENVLNREVMLMSFGVTRDFVLDEIDGIPNILLSGFRSISKNKNTVLTRVFVMEDIPFDLIQTVRSYSFSKTENRQFKSYVEAGVILVDANNFAFYSNSSAAAKYPYFRVINPVETADADEEKKDHP